MRAQWSGVATLLSVIVFGGSGSARAQQNDPTHLMESLGQGEGRWTSQQIADEAMKSAPSLTRSTAALERSQAGAERAYAAVWPRLDLSFRYTRLSRVQQGGITGDSQAGFDALQALVDAQPDDAGRAFDQGVLAGLRAQSSFTFPQVLDQFAFRAALSYPVSDLFLSILPAYEASKGLVQAQALRGQADRSTVALQAKEAFYNYARARAAYLVAQSGLEQAKAHQADVAVLVGGGALAPVEQMRATAAVAAAEVALARSEAGVAVSREAIAVMIHQDLAADPAIGEDLTRVVAGLPSRQALVEQAFTRRPEAQALSQTLSALDLSIRAQQNAGLPHLNVVAGFDFANPNQRIFPQNAVFKPSWDVGAVLSWSPNDWQTSGLQASEARAERAQVVADLEALRDALKLEVSQAYEDCVAANRALASATPGIVAAEESYRVRREQFRAGSAVATDVLDSEGELRAARLQLINVAIDLRIAEARLDRAVGGLQSPSHLP